MAFEVGLKDDRLGFPNAGLRYEACSQCYFIHSVHTTAIACSSLGPM